jgi:hypothetical protein
VGSALLSACLFNKVPSNRKRVASLNVDAGVLWSLHNDLPYADPNVGKRVTILALGPSFWWQPATPIEIGVAAGVYRFSGRAFDAFTRLYVKPVQVRVRPFAIKSDTSWKSQVLVIQAGYALIPKGFTAADFGAVGPFKTEHEVLPTLGVALDLEPFIKRHRAAAGSKPAGR